MYYFYFNFPNFNDRTILIHRKECGFCKSETGSTYNGFWAGPFSKMKDAEICLQTFNGFLKKNFEFAKCRCCQ